MPQLKRKPSIKKIQPKETTTKKSQNLISTGSTLLDLSISGGVYHGGGVEIGIIMEIFGPPSIGKTALLSEMAASCQIRGGKVFFLDPESRFNEQYAKKYGFNIDTSNPNQYAIPKTVEGMFETITEKFEVDHKKPNLCCGDSIAALTTETELKTGDKMGMKKAKEMSRLLRMHGRFFKEKNILMAFTNQERQSDSGWFVPGGNAVPYYSSLRIRMFRAKGEDPFELKTSLGGNDRVFGVCPTAKIIKSSIDDPFRANRISIVFGYGIDDILDNIDYLIKTKGIFSVGEKEYKTSAAARRYMDQNPHLTEELREKVIKEWYKQEEELKERIRRAPKVRR